MTLADILGYTVFIVRAFDPEVLDPFIVAERVPIVDVYPRRALRCSVNEVELKSEARMYVVTPEHDCSSLA